MVFIETSIFTRRLAELLSDESYAELQLHLSETPDAGVLIRDSGGLRKLRWAGGGKGKRGGLRVIYYHATADFQIRMLQIYSKCIQENLAPGQRAVLRVINEGWK
jgi:mRNA-degrading endonuclease RelE of RelBE toxin-antitoxin system